MNELDRPFQKLARRCHSIFVKVSRVKDQLERILEGYCKVDKLLAHLVVTICPMIQRVKQSRRPVRSRIQLAGVYMKSHRNSKVLLVILQEEHLIQ